ncbi:Protein CBG03806 [Caenorhabditis briggsae]|uniref:Uncharacterized protein n=2 Tax=Caenorhabditis briggsae TaxID=6238 RepID=A0AAE9DUX2_CAEBR|nr:Protein CBG03806 [Caenorhabditis briggsae]ULU10875.1 hypothetical protein L3Y34_014836 [Caenorhabditis briggsae]UMM11827.1 hypothetical protein L5515_000910 [Caenorhabditis briggsae]CAP24634.1 Protein CBG03806 [Caenorhabditis briggsae]
MINIFNSPIDATQLDEFAQGKQDENGGEETVFDVKKRKPQVTYGSDGRRMLDGIVEDKQESNALWTTTISRGVANEWREEATGTRLQKTKRYIYKVSYDAQVLVRQTYRRHATPILIVTNLTLFLLFMYICRLFPFNK